MGVVSVTRAFYRAPLVGTVFDLVAFPSRHTARMVVHELRGLAAGMRVLDLGIGTGLIASRVARELPVELTGIDFSPRMLERARRRMGPDARLVTGDIRDLRSFDDPYDAVLCNQVLKYLPAKDISRVVDEISRVAATSSIVIVSDLRLPFGAWRNKRRLKSEFFAKGFFLLRTRHPVLSTMLVFGR